MGDREARLGEDIEEKVQCDTKEPSMYRVVLLNDDYTTMEFVIHVLETIFKKPAAEAVQIMLSVHKKGSGLCGVYTREIAETKLSAVHSDARHHGYPLKCIMEKE